MLERNRIYNLDVLEGLRRLDDNSINCCITSPPYWGLRDYGMDGQIGLESTIEEYIEKMVSVFREVKRVLKPEGTLWLNMGDCYSGSGGPGGDYKNGRKGIEYGSQYLPRGLKPKDLCGMPWRIAFALQADGWYLRSDIIWSKKNPMPESCRDRPTKAHEYVFLMSKSAKYFYDADAIREEQKISSLERLKTGWDGNKKRDWPGTNHNNFDKYMGKTQEEIDLLPGRNKRTVWTIATQPFPGAHFATFPEKLVEPCIMAGCPAGGLVLDPFMGSGTVALVAHRLDRDFIGFELSKEYCEMADKRIKAEVDQGRLFVETPN